MRRTARPATTLLAAAVAIGFFSPVSATATATVGRRISKSGSTSHLTSGSVQRLNVTVNYAEGSVYQLIQTTALVNPGDSGGCLFAGPASSRWARR